MLLKLIKGEKLVSEILKKKSVEKTIQITVPTTEFEIKDMLRKAIVSYCVKKNISLTDFAKKIGVGKSTAEWWIQGSVFPSAKNLASIINLISDDNTEHK